MRKNNEAKHEKNFPWEMWDYLFIGFSSTLGLHQNAFLKKLVKQFIGKFS
jgi:hypothetical protein